MSRRNKRRNDWRAAVNVTAPWPRENELVNGDFNPDDHPFTEEEDFSEAKGNGGSESPGWRRLVAHHPVLCLVAGFGVGVGIGVLGVAVFGPARKGHSFDPRGRLHQFSEALRELPAMITDHLPESKLWS